MSGKHCTLAGIAILAGITAAAIESAGQDWTQWRGPNRDGTVTSFTEPRAWPEQLTQQWKVEIGLGYATPLVVGNKIYQFSRQGEDEVMSALEAATGKLLWRTAYPASFKMHPNAARHGPGPKSTPLYADGKLYSIGMTGTVTALDAATGKTLWRKPGSPVMPRFTSHAFSPLLDRGLVIFHVGGHNQGALTAFDANTGKEKWSWKGDGPGYGSPMVAELGGTRQIVAITQTKLVGVDAATGALLWERPQETPNFTNALTPIVYGQTLIISGRENPIIAVTVAKRDNQWITETVWENADATMRMSNGVIVGDKFFSLSSLNSGQYFSMDAKTGKTLWKSEGRQAVNAAILKAGDTIFSLENDGEMVVFRGGQTGFESMRRYKVAETETWAAPVIQGNRVFVKDVSSLALWTF